MWFHSTLAAAGSERLPTSNNLVSARHDAVLIEIVGWLDQNLMQIWVSCVQEVEKEAVQDIPGKKSRKRTTREMEYCYESELEGRA